MTAWKLTFILPGDPKGAVTQPAKLNINQCFKYHKKNRPYAFNLKMH